MGFFDNLLRQGAREITSGLAKAATNAIIDELKGDKAPAQNAQTAPATVTYEPEDNAPAGYEGLGDADVDKKLEAVFAKEFPQYEIRKEVSPTTIGGTGKFLDYSYGVYENGIPKLFIMVVYNNTCASRYYRWSKEAAAKAGVPMINFVYAFENKITYIIPRLHQYL